MHADMIIQSRLGLCAQSHRPSEIAASLSGSSDEDAKSRNWCVFVRYPEADYGGQQVSRGAQRAKMFGDGLDIELNVLLSNPREVNFHQNLIFAVDILLVNFHTIGIWSNITKIKPAEQTRQLGDHLHGSS